MYVDAPVRTATHASNAHRSTSSKPAGGDAPGPHAAAPKAHAAAPQPVRSAARGSSLLGQSHEPALHQPRRAATHLHEPKADTGRRLRTLPAFERRPGVPIQDGPIDPKRLRDIRRGFRDRIEDPGPSFTLPIKRTAPQPGFSHPFLRIGDPKPTFRHPILRPNDPQPRAQLLGNHETKADHVPTVAKRGVQAVGGAIRGLGASGGAGSTIAGALKFRGIPGAAIVSGGIAAYDTFREFQHSGFSRKTAKTAAGGIGGVAGAYQGGIIGASIGAAGGPVGAVVGGAAGALIGGFVGSKVGQGAVDAVAGAIHHLPGVAHAVSDAASDAAHAVGDAASGAAHAVGDAADAVGDAVGGAIDKITPW